jgi:hypothetical protein
LHFCGLKIWTIPKEEPIPEPSPEEEEPEPVKPIVTVTGTVVPPKPELPTCDKASMSSQWEDVRNNPCNPIKTEHFNPRWGGGEFTCIHTLKDKDGAWWKTTFGSTLEIIKVQILNRKDCCGDRLNGAKVYIGEELMGTIDDAP